MSNSDDQPRNRFAHHYGNRHPHQQQGGIGMALGAMGVVFGDIGTSPLYTLRECFTQSGAALDLISIYGFLSLIFWALTIIVSFKYVFFLLRANNRGEGGIMALAALVLQGMRKRPQLRYAVIATSVLGMALFYGDGMITPAISVLSAIEGLSVFSHVFEDLVLPITLCVLVGLFTIQRYGTRAIGRISAPVMLTWFVVIGALGLWQIVRQPHILLAINPYFALQFVLLHPATAALGLGAVVLCVTGAEAIYSDMGHFGPRPIRHAWYLLVYPALLLNYFGQGALLLITPEAIDNPFFRMVPEIWVLPLVGLSTLATIIASQAVITGAFSLSNQAIQLGLLPRMTVRHTDAHQRGQIYVPQINWFLLGGVILLLMNFHSSSALAGMYGVAVTGTMLCTSILIALLMKMVWRVRLSAVILISGLFIGSDLVLFGSTMIKIHHGGYVSLLIGLSVFAVMMTWRRGREMMLRMRRKDSQTLAEFIDTMEQNPPLRVPGVAVYMAFQADVVPYPLQYNLRHNKVLHECIVLLTVRSEERPFVPEGERLVVAEEKFGIWHIIVRYGFMESPRVLRELHAAESSELNLNLDNASFFVGRDRLLISDNSTMARWRLRLFSWLANNAVSATDYYHLPRARVLEMGAQVEI